MTETRRKAEEAAFAIRKAAKLRPRVGIILGTGLGALAREITNATAIPYSRVPHFPLTTVETHEGQVVVGKLDKKPVIVMQGRLHYYEGYSLPEVTFPVRVMRCLGVETLLISNIAGGLNPNYSPGDLVVITDHINLIGDNPLRGPNEEEFGPRFPDMSEPYSRKLIQVVETTALKLGIKLQRGVYVALSGPSLETAAEYRFLRIIGADLVGMSTVPEVIVAAHCGMRVLALSGITDQCLPDALKPANVTEILRIAANIEPDLTRIFSAVVARL